MKVINPFTGQVVNYNPDQPRDESGRWAAVTVYHGTTEAALESITKSGLVPRYSKGADAWAVKAGLGNYATTYKDAGRDASVFVSTDDAHASIYAARTASLSGSVPVVLRIEVPPGQGALLEDEAGGTTKSLRFEGTIPPEWINGVFDIDYENDRLKERT